MIHWVHRDPGSVHAHSPHQLARDGLGIAQQRIEVAARVKDIPLALEGAAIAPDHIVLLDQQYIEAAGGQQIGANQTADTGTGHHRVIDRVGALAEPYAFEQPFHPSGRLRP